MDSSQALGLPLLISPLGVAEPLGNSAELHYQEYKESGKASSGRGLPTPPQYQSIPHPQFCLGFTLHS